MYVSVVVFSAPQLHYVLIFAMAKLTKLANFRHNLLPLSVSGTTFILFLFFIVSIDQSNDLYQINI